MTNCKFLSSRRFFSAETGTSASPTLRRTMSHKKRAEVIGKKLGPSFVKCVNDLQNATGVSEVFDTLLGLSAAYVSNQQVLQQVQEEFDVEDTYFYEKEVLFCPHLCCLSPLTWTFSSVSFCDKCEQLGHSCIDLRACGHCSSGTTYFLRVATKLVPL